MPNFQSQTAISDKGGSIVISSTDSKEYISLSQHKGAGLSLNNNGISVTTPNNYQIKVDNDSYETVSGEHNTYYNKTSWQRYNADVNVIVGDSTAIHTDAYTKWSDKFSTIANFNATPTTKVPAFAILPGADPTAYPQTSSESGTRAKDPAGIELQEGELTLNEATWVPNSPINLEPLGSGTFWMLNDQSVDQFENQQPPTPGDSPSTQGGNFEPTEKTVEKLTEVIVNTQEELVEIERLIGNGGNDIKTVIGNKTLNIGAANNLHPQAIVNPIGRAVPSAVQVTTDGVSTKIAGVPDVQEVENSAVFPCGNYDINIGNKFSVSTGGGGIALQSASKIDLISETTAKLLSYQVIVGGTDVQLKGKSNLSIESDNLNLTSSNQIVLNGNVGLNNNLLVKGGAYINGELYVNHITGPLEIQKTIPGFTSSGAFGFLVSNQGFSTKNVTGMGRITILGAGIIDATFFVAGANLQQTIESSDLCVELTPHAHEFANIPISTIASGDISAQAGVRQEASSLNTPINSPAKSISNGQKLSFAQTYTDEDLIFANSSTAVSVLL